MSGGRVVYEVSPKQFHALLEREKTYTIIKVKYSNYKTDKVEGDAFIFEGLEQNIDKQINPRTHYFHICRKAAYMISKAYGKDWDKTTYLANDKRVSDLKDLIDVKEYKKLETPYKEEKL